MKKVSFIKETTLQNLILNNKGNDAYNFLMINSKLDVDFQDYNHNTLLTLAVNHKFDNVALELIDRGADVNLTNMFGNNSLMSACSDLNYNLVNVLLNKNINIFNLSSNNHSGFYWACLNSKDYNDGESIIKLFFEKTKSLDEMNKLLSLVELPKNPLSKENEYSTKKLYELYNLYAFRFVLDNKLNKRNKILDIKKI